MTTKTARPPTALQLLAAFGLLVLMALDWRLAATTAVALALVFPPAPWRPAALGSTLGRALGAYAIWLLVWVAFAAAYLRAMAAVGQPLEPQTQLLELAQHGTAVPDFWARVALIVLAAPLIEEIVFRGYLYAGALRLAPVWLAQVVVAALFGLAHGLEHALPIAVLSLVFGYLRQRHGCLLPSMVAHATHNALTVSLVVCWPSLLDLLYAR